MRHQKNSKRLGRITSHRKAMFRNMATSLLDKSRIETTELKAKELRHYVEKMITLGKRGDLHARRQALAFLRSEDVVTKVFGEYAERFKDRPGGYTRIMKLANRTGDNARMAIIELIGEKEPKEKERTAKPAEEKDMKEAKGKDKPAAKPAAKAAGKTEKKAAETTPKAKKTKAAANNKESEEKDSAKKTKKEVTKK
jgi:large subunit ribosomal protein L17